MVYKFIPPPEEPEPYFHYGESIEVDMENMFYVAIKDGEEVDRISIIAMESLPDPHEFYKFWANRVFGD